MLFAVHISDGVLAGPWVAGGWAVAVLLVARSAARIGDAEVPRVGVLTAAFFVASQVHLPLGGVSVHLLLNGLVGVVLGRRAPLAVAVGLALQALLFGHGGLTTLGVNVSVYALPALVAGVLCGPVRRSGFVRVAGVRFALVTLTAVVSGGVAVVAAQRGLARLLPESVAFPTLAATWIADPVVLCGVLVFGLLIAAAERRLEADPEFAVGVLLGAGTAFTTVGLNCVVLALGGRDEVSGLAEVVLLAHLPVILVEAVTVGFVVAYLARARPEWVGGAYLPGSGNTSSNGTSH